MLQIKTTEHFDTITKKRANVVCFIFMSNKNQQDKSLATILACGCQEEGIELYSVEINNVDLFDLVSKYGTGLLPKYVFIKDGKMLHTAYGLTSKETVKQEIKIAGDEV